MPNTNEEFYQYIADFSQLITSMIVIAFPLNTREFVL